MSPSGVGLSQTTKTPQNLQVWEILPQNKEGPTSSDKSKMQH